MIRLSSDHIQRIIAWRDDLVRGTVGDVSKEDQHEFSVKVIWFGNSVVPRIHVRNIKAMKMKIKIVIIELKKRGLLWEIAF